MVIRLEHYGKNKTVVLPLFMKNSSHFLIHYHWKHFSAISPKISTILKFKGIRSQLQRTRFCVKTKIQTLVTLYFPRQLLQANSKQCAQSIDPECIAVQIIKAEEKNWLENRACGPSECGTNVQGHNVVSSYGFGPSSQRAGQVCIMSALLLLSLSVFFQSLFIESSSKLDKTSFVERFIQTVEHFLYDHLCPANRFAFKW